MSDQTEVIVSHISSDTQQAGVSANSPGSAGLRFESLFPLHLNLAAKPRRKYSFHQITKD